MTGAGAFVVVDVQFRSFRDWFLWFTAWTALAFQLAKTSIMAARTHDVHDDQADDDEARDCIGPKDKADMIGIKRHIRSGRVCAGQLDLADAMADKLGPDSHKVQRDIEERVGNSHRQQRPQNGGMDRRTIGA